MPQTILKQPDEDLCALGIDLDKHIIDYRAAEAEYRPLWQAFFDRVNGPRPAGETYQEFYKRAWSESGLPELERAHISPDAVINRMSPTNEAILAMPATTLAGLAVKATLAKFENADLWDDPEDEADWDKLVLRKLVDAVLDAAAAR